MMSESRPPRRGRKTDVERDGGKPWARKLRAARVGANLSLAELAAAADLDRRTVESYDAGRRSPSVESALALARALGRTVEELFG